MLGHGRRAVTPLLDALAQDVDGLAGKLVDVHRDRAQRRRAVRSLAHAVEADHRHVVRHADAMLAQRAQRAESDRVGHAEQPVEREVPLLDAPRNRAVRVVGVPVEQLDRVGLGQRALMPLERAMTADQTSVAHVHRPARLVGRHEVRTDQPDALAPYLEQVRHRGLGAVLARREHRVERPLVRLVIEQHHRLAPA